MTFWAAYDFWRDTLLAIVLAGVLCSYLGVYIVLRRVVFVGAALTQISGVGIVLSFWLASFVQAGDPHAEKLQWWLSPQLFSLLAALAGALLFAFNRGKQRMAAETVVALGWLIASASLLLILASKRIVQEAHEVDDLLYGSAVLVSDEQVLRLAVIAALVLLVHLAFFKELLFVSYDALMAETLGYRTVLWDAVLYASFGVAVSLAVRTVGALPSFAFLVIPATAAQLLVRRVHWAFPLAMLFGSLGGALGYYVAFVGEYPTGPSIVVSCTLFLVPGVLLRTLRGRS